MSIAFVLLVPLVVIALYAIALRARVARLERQESEKKKILDRTAKLLVQKNLELFDESVEQQKKIQSREDFVGIIAHQLRTPATEIKWGLEALERLLQGTLKSGQREYIEKVRTSADRMVRIIDNLVRLVKSEDAYRHLSIPPYEPDTLIRAVAGRVAAEFAKKKIVQTLALGAPGTIQSMDSDSLDMIVTNLVENAYHYTPEGGTVKLASAYDADQNLSVEVSDTGIGISPEKQKTMFVKFQRANTAVQMNSSGMGLGLYVARTIIERHGGSMSFTTEEGKGSTFRFTLPSQKINLGVRAS